jgi:hypothetical protein
VTLARARRGARAGARRICLGAALVGLAAALGAGGCGEPCCQVDSEPILVARAPLGQGAAPGAMLARARLPNAGPPFFDMVIDTASPLTILAGATPTGTLEIQTGGFDLLAANRPDSDPAVRARFRGLGLFQLPLGPVGDVATVPKGVMGGDLLRVFSTELRFAGPCPGAPLAAATDAGADDAGSDAGGADAGADGASAGGPRCSSVTFWPHQGASLGFLEDAGYSVIRFTPYGGGETTARAPADALGLQAPVTLPATRIVFRACAAPRAFSPTESREACCVRGDEISRSTGVDLALLLATGVGPMVLSQSAFARVAPSLPTPPTMTPGPLYVASWPSPIEAEWTTLNRFALVDGFEPPSTGDEGPCVDLARARRIEWTDVAIAAVGAAETPFDVHPKVADCVQPCDTDPSEPSVALSSAAYLELGGAIPVAVIQDSEPFLQALRFDIRPEGPDIDGLVGAAALGAARVELDYLSDQPRAIFSCEAGTTRDACFAGARCPRLPDGDQQHLCFGLPSHGLPSMCAPSGCP